MRAARLSRYGNTRYHGSTLQPDAPLGGDWTVVLDDEFSTGTLNTSLWTPYLDSEGGEMNNVGTYSANVSVSGGYLNLYLASSSSGASISSDPSDGVSGHTGFQFTYGYIEARVNCPGSSGEIYNWPAFWAVGQNWPVDGELDVFEGLSGQAAYHFHYGSDDDSWGSSVSGDYTGWHVYGANWYAGQVDYYYDGVLVGSVTQDVTSQPMYIIANIGTGEYGGPEVTPSTVQVDYIRVWQQE